MVDNYYLHCYGYFFTKKYFDNYTHSYIDQETLDIFNKFVTYYTIIASQIHKKYNKKTYNIDEKYINKIRKFKYLTSYFFKLCNKKKISVFNLHEIEKIQHNLMYVSSCFQDYRERIEEQKIKTQQRISKKENKYKKYTELHYFISD